MDLPDSPSPTTATMRDAELAANDPEVAGTVAGGTWRWPDEHPWGRVRLFLLTALAYSGGSQLALLLIKESGLSSVFFIPAGITVAFLLRVQRRSWWVVVVAAGTAEATMDLIAGFSVGATAGYVAANMIEPVIGALIVTGQCGVVDLARLRHVWWFFVGAIMTGPAIGAAVGSLPALLLGDAGFATQFWQWWLGDSLGVVLVGSAILVWGSSLDRRSLTSAGGAGLIGGTLVLTFGVLALTELPLMFLVLIVVAVAGAMFGTRAVAMTALVVAVTIAIEVGFGIGGLIIGLSPAVALIIVKLQLWVFTMAGLVIAAEAHELEDAIKAAVEATAQAAISETERRLEQDIAVRLQRALLPENPIQHLGLDIAARYEAGSEAMVVGGDWYDVIALFDGRIGITIGDVVGHGLEAAATMGRLRTAMAALAVHTDSPGTLLSYVDEYSRGTNRVEYASAAYSILDPKNGLLTFASAGHPPMLVISPSGETRWLMEGRSPPFHGAALVKRSEASVQLEPGSLLLGFSDGLVERRGENLDQGMERLAAKAREVSNRSASEICDILLEAMGVATIREDDVVVIAIRYEAASLPSDAIAPIS